MAATWKHYSAKQDLYSDPKRKDWFRNIPWKKTLTLATNTYASCRQIQVAEFNQCYSLASELSLDSSIILFSAKQRIFTAILGIHLKMGEVWTAVSVWLLGGRLHQQTILYTCPVSRSWLWRFSWYDTASPGTHISMTWIKLHSPSEIMHIIKQQRNSNSVGNSNNYTVTQGDNSCVQMY